MVGVTVTNQGVLPLRVFCLRPWAFCDTVDPSVEAPPILFGLLCLPDAVAIIEMLTDDTHALPLLAYSNNGRAPFCDVKPRRGPKTSPHTDADHHHWCKNTVPWLERGMLNQTRWGKILHYDAFAFCTALKPKWHDSVCKKNLPFSSGVGDSCLDIVNIMANMAA